MNKPTNELMQMLHTEEQIETYLSQNKEEFLDVPLCSYLNQLLTNYAVPKNEVIKRSCLNQIYAYQIFAGTKHPTRDKLIALIFGFPLHLDDAQRLLRVGQVSELYPRKKRDSIILFGLQKNLSIQEVDDLLFELGEETIV
ncbi:hypothetical protein BN3661_02102 [Eubacteriaceae bacterium CHKCI005]|nr:hypothetical protein BN3661_02102 [Eubacteriaceae bacterium CHKCI005]